MFSCKLQPLRLLDFMVFLKQKRDRGFLRAAGRGCRLPWLSEEWRNTGSAVQDLTNCTTSRTCPVAKEMQRICVLEWFFFSLQLKGKQFEMCQNINGTSAWMLNEEFYVFCSSPARITKAALTRSILFPTSIFTRSFLVQYVSSSLSQLSSFVKVSRRVTSYTAKTKTHDQTHTHTLYAQYN